MEMHMEMILPYKLAYMRQIGPYGSANVITMARLKNWAKERELLDESATILGIAQDSPETTPPEACRYDVGIIIGREDSYEDIQEAYYIGGAYAVFKIEHTEAAIQKAWTEVFDELLKKEIRIDETRPILERYPMKMVQKGHCEICVPIEEKIG